MEKINLAVVCDSIDYTLGGSSISAKRFISSLKKEGFKITLITNNIQHPNSKFFKGLNVVEIENHYIFKSKNYIFGRVSHKKLVDIFRKNNIDIIYSIYPTTFSGNAAAKAAKILKIPIIGHFHVQAENISVLFSKFYLDVLFYKLFKGFYNKCNLVIVPSMFAKDLLAKSGVITKKVVVSNGVDLDIFKKQSKPSKLNYTNNDSCFKFLYLGRLEKEKDIFTLVKAAEIILKTNINVIFLIAGTGSVKKSLAKYIDQKGLQKNIKLLGYIKQKDIVNLYNAADCFVSPSLIELEGMTVLEAMACGLPIILSNSKRSASKYFVEKNGFLFKSKNYKDLSSKINLVINMNSSKLNKLGEQSIVLSKNYSFITSCKKLMRIIDDTLINANK